MAYSLSNIIPEIVGKRQVLLKLSLVVGCYTFRDTVYIYLTVPYHTVQEQCRLTRTLAFSF